MKCTNRLEKLVLLGTLFAASMSIRADGTLPIPVSPDELPLTMNGAATDGNNRRRILEVSVDQAWDNAGSQLKSRCRSNENFYPAGGRIVIDSDSFAIKGICSRGAAPSGQKQIIATSGSELIQLDGTLNGTSSITFNGQMKRESMYAPAPEAGGNASRFNFNLTRSGY